MSCKGYLKALNRIIPPAKGGKISSYSCKQAAKHDPVAYGMDQLLKERCTAIKEGKINDK